MEEKVLTLITYYDEEQYYSQHEAYMDGKRIFRAADLTDCPEDAIIGRDIFDGHDFLAAVDLGYKMAQDGYKLNMNVIEAKSEEEFEKLCADQLTQ